MNPKLRTFAIWSVLVVAFIALCIGLGGDDDPIYTIETFEADLQAEQVSHVMLDGSMFVVNLHSGLSYQVPQSPDSWNLLDGYGISPGADDSLDFWLVGLVVAVLIVAGVIAVLRRQNAQSQAPNIFEMRKSKARELKPGAEATRFTDVGGHDEAKLVLGDVVQFLKNPDRWQKAGVRLPRGILLEGPPGGGKTLLARAVAGEAGVPVFTLSASEFVEMFVGVGAARVRDLFEQAGKAAPAVLFIDEIDAVGRRRGSGIGSGNDEREQTLNQLLVCLDGFTPTTRLVVIAATNRSDVLDRALLRPGRFDIRLVLDWPDTSARETILGLHCRGKTLGDVQLARIATQTEGYSGAMLESLCNDAALRAVRRGGAVTAGDFEGALATSRKIERRFDALDALMVESASQFAVANGLIRARLQMEGETIEGRVLWADANFVKIEPEGLPSRLVPKRGLRWATSLEGAGVDVPAPVGNVVPGTA